MDNRSSPNPERVCSAARLFDVIWESMVEVLGSPATATLIRRSVQRVSKRRRDLDELRIDRQGFDYGYTVPAEWAEHSAESSAAFRELAHDLSPLLVQLTGTVIVRRLNALIEVQRSGIRFEEDA